MFLRLFYFFSVFFKKAVDKHDNIYYTPIMYLDGGNKKEPLVIETLLRLGIKGELYNLAILQLSEIMRKHFSKTWGKPCKLIVQRS